MENARNDIEALDDLELDVYKRQIMRCIQAEARHAEMEFDLV